MTQQILVDRFHIIISTLIIITEKQLGFTGPIIFTYPKCRDESHMIGRIKNPRGFTKW